VDEEGCGRVFRVEVEELVESELVETLEATDDTRERSTKGILVEYRSNAGGLTFLIKDVKLGLVVALRLKVCVVQVSSIMR
jgi:hypothetical protein